MLDINGVGEQIRKMELRIASLEAILGGVIRRNCLLVDPEHVVDLTLEAGESHNTEDRA